MIIAADPVKFGHLEGHCETPEFTGHVIWALINDPKLGTMSGKTLVGAEIARKYRLTDGGRVPQTAKELHNVSPIAFYAAEIR